MTFSDCRKNYSSLVPGKVQHRLFWARYFYKVHLIEKQEAKRQVLKKRAEQTKIDSDSDNLGWDEDDDDVENVQDIPGKHLYQQLHSFSLNHFSLT